MKLDNKKRLAANALKIGKGRIMLVESRLDEIKEAITKQDIKDLVKAGAIKIKEIKGRKAVKKRKTKRQEGKIKMKVSKRKQEYVKITRKLRAYAKELKNNGKLGKAEYKIVRKKIKAKDFKSKSQLKDYLKEGGTIK
jgi:large subunit ribosomal protein L19e